MHTHHFIISKCMSKMQSVILSNKQKQKTICLNHATCNFFSKSKDVRNVSQAMSQPFSCNCFGHLAHNMLMSASTFLLLLKTQQYLQHIGFHNYKYENSMPHLRGAFST